MLRNKLICAAIAVAAFVWLGNTNPAAAQEGNTQASALYRLQARGVGSARSATGGLL
jgi:hypothetical protein